MKVQKLYLQGFRSYGQRMFDFASDLTLFVGPNGQGKTNILEALYLLATGESFRADKIEEMILWNEEVAHVGGVIIKDANPKTLKHSSNKDRDSLIKQTNDQAETVQLKMVLTRGELQGKKVAKRRYLVNDVPRRKKDFTGIFKAVEFLPEDLEMMSGSPSKRRSYFDEVLVQVDRVYQQALLSYEKALKRRNKLLDLVQDGKTNRAALTFWDQLLVRHGNVLTEKRRDFVTEINEREREKGFEGLRMEYLPSTISEARLNEYGAKEVVAGHTLIGPHRDDFTIVTSNKLKGTGKDMRVNLGVYGSRGQQRMGVLWLKISQLWFVEHFGGETPALLLDDVFSELDEEHEEMVMGLTEGRQTIITTTEDEGLRWKGKGEVVKI